MQTSFSRVKQHAMQIVLSALTVLLLVLSAVAVFIPTVDGEMPPPKTAKTAPTTEASSPSAAEASAHARKKGVQSFLLCGKDRASGLYDVIILARIDAEQRSASLVQIPRDTYAAYTDRSYRKLNGAASALGGMREMATFLSDALGIPIDHYVLVDLDCIGDVVDAVGGVTLTIPRDMDYEDSAQGLSIHLKAGTQTLNGDTAEQFLRYRSGYVTADLGRLDAQKLFLASFLGAVKENSTLPGLVRIVRSLYGRVETDLSLGDCVRLISVGLKLSPERLTMETLPGEATRTGENSGAWYYVLNRDAAHETVDRLLNVYDAPLSKEKFDPSECFTNPSYAHFEEIYRRPRASGKTVNGEDAEAHYGALPRLP